MLHPAGRQPIICGEEDSAWGILMGGRRGGWGPSVSGLGWEAMVVESWICKEEGTGVWL